MSLAELYARHSLPPGSKTIRVLNIESVPELTQNALDEPIRCTLCTVDLDLDDRPKFTALSYVWGVDPPTPQHFLFCGELRIPVTKNCESALRHLRQTIDCLTIWVDAVCINQADDAEKALQIPLMGDIYSSADPVYVWLGEATPGTDRALRYFNEGSLEKYFCPPRLNAAAWSLFLFPWSRVHCPVPLRGSRKPLVSTVNYTNFEDLKEVFLRPWIHRVW
ncbi:heterokaryon incompatibility protein-domain-containing protein [Paraphoma chrysanthemicola]|uniref:Heterokaryon incompatibility protein-domain-containing protein n=1 Tax=Paraphoma chrysanthemicola TaxID=798071 RepID=A0A8K0R547_9PLEO|nr:heterokaryon incompatibility protein-domain-containing protein [Paraphoma chrysanthemicola]